ncbi:MAG TPA: ROK family protein [Bryobacteraceae bacterium]|jgi:glucokinase
MNSVLAVDFGGTKTALAFVDDAGRVTDKQKLAAEYTLAGSMRQVAEFVNAARVERVGILVPGIYDAKTGAAWAPNLWGMERVPLRAAAEQALGIPVAIASDRAGYALGEEWLGVARGLDDVVFVAVGTGIGVGILSGGRVIEGARGIAGAAGWMVLGDPWKEEYRQCGGWETEAAGPALARRAGMESAEAVVAAARAGESKARAALDTTADYLALGVAALISVLNPEMVVLGGGLLHASDLMIDRIRGNALRWTQPIAAQSTKIEKTALGEDAGLLGAARVAMKTYVSK